MWKLGLKFFFVRFKYENCGKLTDTSSPPSLLQSVHQLIEVSNCWNCSFLLYNLYTVNQKVHSDEGRNLVNSQKTEWINFNPNDRGGYSREYCVFIIIIIFCRKVKLPIFKGLLNLKEDSMKPGEEDKDFKLSSNSWRLILWPDTKTLLEILNWQGKSLDRKPHLTKSETQLARKERVWRETTVISRKNFIACSKIVIVQFNRPGECSPEKDCFR